MSPNRVRRQTHWVFELTQKKETETVTSHSLCSSCCRWLSLSFCSNTASGLNSESFPDEPGAEIPLCQTRGTEQARHLGSKTSPTPELKCPHKHGALSYTALPVLLLVRVLSILPRDGAWGDNTVCGEALFLCFKPTTSSPPSPPLAFWISLLWSHLLCSFLCLWTNVKMKGKTSVFIACILLVLPSGRCVF